MSKTITYEIIEKRPWKWRKIITDEVDDIRGLTHESNHIMTAICEIDGYMEMEYKNDNEYQIIIDVKRSRK